MGNYKDRGIMKWAPFESLDGRQDVLEELIFNLGKKNITTFSNDTLAFMDENAKYAIENNKNVSRFCSVYGSQMVARQRQR